MHGENVFLLVTPLACMVLSLQAGCGKIDMVLNDHTKHNTGVHSRVGRSIGGELVSTNVDVGLEYLSSTILEPPETDAAARSGTM
jgi:hypothetical protein